MAGICHQKAGELEKAADMFENVRDDASAGKLRQKAAESLDAVKAIQKMNKPYMLYLKLEFQHDDNILLEPSQAIIDQQENIEEQLCRALNLSSACARCK